MKSPRFPLVIALLAIILALVLAFLVAPTKADSQELGPRYVINAQERLIWDYDQDKMFTDADSTASRWSELRHDGSDMVRGLNYQRRVGSHYGLILVAPIRRLGIIDGDVGEQLSLPATILAPAPYLRIEIVGDMVLIRTIEHDGHWGEGESQPDSSEIIVPEFDGWDRYYMFPIIHRKDVD